MPKNAEKCRKMPKNAEKFICEECDFKCCNIKYYYRYLFTRTYNMLTNAYLRLLKCLLMLTPKKPQKKPQKIYF